MSKLYKKVQASIKTSTRKYTKRNVISDEDGSNKKPSKWSKPSPQEASAVPQAFLPAAAAPQLTNNFASVHQQLAMSINPISSVFQQNFLHAHLIQASAVHQALNLDLLEKARLCQANAYSGPGLMAQLQPITHEALQQSVELAEKDIAAETLCSIRNIGQRKWCAPSK